MRLPVVLLIAHLACHSRAVVKTAAEPTAGSDDAFAHVLSIANSRTVGARDELASLRHTEQNEDARRAASRIVLLWNEDARTYFSETPLPLYRDCVGDAALQDLRKMIDVTASVDVEVDVNAEGSVTMATVRRGSGLETVDHIIASEVRKLRFLPAKPAETYAPGTIRISCHIEAR